jgi:broad-specificity NMP kinase
MTQAAPERRRRPRLVELAGPAGAGKSSVCGALRSRYSAAQGTIWGQPVLPLLGNGAQLVPTLAGFWLHARSLLWDESRHMVRLRTLHRGLGQNRESVGEVMIFDEGPIFALAWLRGFGHASLRSPIADSWWRATLRQWANTVDVVVVLDAPDPLLARRIRNRPEWHEVKDASDAEISAWMARFRSALDWVLAGLALEGGPAVIRVSTTLDDPERLAGQVIKALRRVSSDN